MASTIKVDNVQNQPGTNIVSKCGTDVTLGASGDTVALACGASQTGFGRTGTVDWDTSIKTGTVTAATGSGYFVNTTSGAITVNLPAASVGSIVAVSDYASTSASNNIIISPNGSENINGINAVYTMATAGLAVTLVYADATKGWKSITGSDADATGILPYVAATGGTPCAGATCGDYKIHTFTGPGTLSVSAGGSPAGADTVEYLVVAGGGTGGSSDGTHGGGGGGAGGFRFASPSLAPLSYPGKPLAGANIPVTTATDYPITVGGGGPGVYPGTNPGSNSVFSTITSAGGGGGGAYGGTSPGPGDGADGGSGGGSHTDVFLPGCEPNVGCGNVPVVSPAQGTPGAASLPNPIGGYTGGGGGGGAIQPGQEAPASGPGQGFGGAGGNGGGMPTGFACNGVPCGGFQYYSGGGGAASRNCAPTNAAAGGKGGGGAAGPTGVSGTVNTGGAGGGSQAAVVGGSGGSGVVVIRYKFQ